MAKLKHPLIVKVGRLYVRDYPLRFEGDWTLTPKRDRIAKFYSEEVAAQATGELKAAGLPAEMMDARADR